MAGKLALAHLGVRSILAFRACFGALCFIVIARIWARRGAELARPSGAELARLAAYAMLGIVINQLCFLSGLKLTTATNATVIGMAIPVFTVAIAVALGRERLSAARVVGLAIACAGVAVLSGVDDFDLGRAHIRGNLLILANSLSYSLFLVLVRDVRERYSPMVLVAWLFALAALVLVPLGTLPFLHAAAALPTRGWLELAFIVAIPTVGAYSLNQYALRHAESSVVALYVYLQPVMVALLAAWILDEQLTARTAIAGALVFAGVFVATRPPRARATIG